MATIAQRIRFSERHLTTPRGDRFDLAGRDWVKDQFWLPADGWKLWPHDKGRICRHCQPKAGRVVQWTEDLQKKLERHKKRSKSCAGLFLSPVIMVVLNLPRREGKTLNTAGFCLSSGFIDKNESMSLIASSEDQAGDLYFENYVSPIKRSTQLDRACSIVGNTITFKKTGSRFEFLSSSFRSITGKGRTKIIIDEARDVAPRVALSLIPSVFSEGGLECAIDARHYHASKTADPPDRCPVCGGALKPWQGRIVIMSSSGLLEGTERDWFADLVNQLEAEPDQNCHLYKLDQSTNPAIQHETKEMVSRVFGALDSTKTYADIETKNTFRRKGSDFVSDRQINSVIDPTLDNYPGSDWRCYGFLDTSKSGDLTSLVIVGEDPVSRHPWELVKVLRIDTWDPRDKGIIDPDDVQRTLDQHVPLFPGLISIGVDVRGGLGWAVDLVLRCRKERPGWGRKIESFAYGQGRDRDLAWGQLEYRIQHRKAVIPNHKILIRELKGTTSITRPNGTITYRDRNRKVSHADIADGLAWSLYAIFKDQSRPRRSMAEANAGSPIKSMMAGVFRPRSADISAGDF